ncbi:MAG: prepilin peptidase [Sulfobacillus sp.]
MSIVVLFVCGLGLGLVLAVASRRWLDPTVSQPWLRQCAGCERPLPAWAWLGIPGARCTHCQTAPSWRERLMTLVAGVLAATGGWLFPDWRQAVPAALFLVVLGVVTWTDLEARLVPDRMLLVAAAGALLIAVAWPPAPWQSALFGALALGGFALLLAIFSRGGLGGGDVKLAAVIGLFLGPAAGVLALLSAFIAAGLWASAMLISRRRRAHDSFALAPYLAVAAAVVLSLRLIGLPFWGGPGVP